MAETPVLAASALAPEAPLDLQPSDLAVFILNVGDGDAIVIRFPDQGAGPRLGVVDAYRGAKAVALLRALGADDLGIEFVCATHPHFDHVSGLRAVVEAFAVREYWDSGFRFTSKTYERLIQAVEERRVAFRRPTSGFEAYVNGVLVAVLSPSIGLRNRYDTYGVDVNNASIVLRLSYPEPPPSAGYPGTPPDAETPPPPALPTRTVVLGGDAQTDAWGTVMVEFPHLLRAAENWAREIGARGGRQPLACDLFKVSHHASKNGVNLELLGRFGDRTGAGPSTGPRWLAVSCGDNLPQHGFPHLVTQALMREVRDPKAKHGGAHQPDHRLGIHYTGQQLEAAGNGGGGSGPAGSLVYVVGGSGANALYRLGEAMDAPVDLTRARRVT